MTTQRVLCNVKSAATGVNWSKVPSVADRGLIYHTFPSAITTHQWSYWSRTIRSNISTEFWKRTGYWCFYNLHFSVRNFSTKLHVNAINHAIPSFIRHPWWIDAHLWINRDRVHNFGFIIPRKWWRWVRANDKLIIVILFYEVYIRVGGRGASKLRYHTIYSRHWRIARFPFGSLGARIYRHFRKSKTIYRKSWSHLHSQSHKILQVIMLFVSACTWKSNNNAANDVESEESSTKPASDQSTIIVDGTTLKPNIFWYREVSVPVATSIETPLMVERTFINYCLLSRYFSCFRLLLWVQMKLR